MTGFMNSGYPESLELFIEQETCSIFVNTKSGDILGKTRPALIYYCIVPQVNRNVVLIVVTINSVVLWCRSGCELLLGALLVRNSSGHVLEKRYFGGGTVDISLARCNYHVSRQCLSDRSYITAHVLFHFSFMPLVFLSLWSICWWSSVSVQWRIWADDLGV